MLVGEKTVALIDCLIGKNFRRGGTSVNKSRAVCYVHHSSAAQSAIFSLSSQFRYRISLDESKFSRFAAVFPCAHFMGVCVWHK